MDHRIEKPPAETHASTNWPLLAGLRFCLAMVVFVWHGDSFSEFPFPLKWFAQWGAFASVCAFLVISGYSIRHSLQQGNDGVGAFYLRRARRIYPVYIVCLLLTSTVFNLADGPVVGPGGQAVPLTWPQLLGHLAFLQGILVGHSLIAGPVWSLAVEAFYYAIAPLLLKMRRAHIWWLIGASCAAYIYFISRGYIDITDFFGAKSILGLGMFWLLGWQIYGSKLTQVETVAVCLGPVLVYALYGTGETVRGTVTLAVTIIALLFGPAIIIPKRYRRPLLYLGELSYPLYLIHFPILWLLYAVYSIKSGEFQFSVCLLATLLTYHLVDAPFRKVKWLMSGASREEQLPPRHGTSSEFVNLPNGTGVQSDVVKQ